MDTVIWLNGHTDIDILNPDGSWKQTNSPILAMHSRWAIVGNQMVVLTYTPLSKFIAIYRILRLRMKCQSGKYRILGHDSLICHACLHMVGIGHIILINEELHELCQDCMNIFDQVESHESPAINTVSHDHMLIYNNKKDKMPSACVIHKHIIGVNDISINDKISEDNLCELCTDVTHTSRSVCTGCMQAYRKLFAHVRSFVYFATKSLTTDLGCGDLFNVIITMYIAAS